MDKILKIRNLKKTYNNNLILDDISFDLNKGEIIGLIGRNGAGKTTLMKSILGLITIDEGTIVFDGQEKYQENKSLMDSIGYLLDCRLFEYLNAYDNLLIQEMYSNIIGTKLEKRKKLEEILEFVELKNDNKKVKDYSFGMKQRLALALALLGDTKLLILDEPFVGLDPVGLEKFKEFILKLNKEKGLTVLISSHQLSEIKDLCERYILIDNKKSFLYNCDESKSVNIKLSYINSEFLDKLKTLDGIQVNKENIEFTYNISTLNKVMELIYNYKLEIIDLNIIQSQLNKFFQ
ncbi:ABC transporter ATP-binding protein [Paraclostridium bifermentans]|uniref:ABC transporter ATP-binding protein n=1 Tax=Paraclostridium bifermentans TaxID=1490 RepID=UPI001896D5B7|nr:ABC transporter ATP-binding protein [Paraclostridium bifermentans]